MLLSGDVRTFDKRQRTFDRAAVRAVWVNRNSDIIVYTDDDEHELTLGTASEEVGRRIAAEIIDDVEFVEAPKTVRTSFLTRKEQVTPGAWIVFRQSGWTTERFAQAVPGSG